MIEACNRSCDESTVRAIYEARRSLDEDGQHASITKCERYEPRWKKRRRGMEAAKGANRQ